LRCQGKEELIGFLISIWFTIVSTEGRGAVSSSFLGVRLLLRRDGAFQERLVERLSDHGSNWQEEEGDEEAGKKTAIRGGNRKEKTARAKTKRVRAYASMSVTYDRRYFRTIGRDNARSGNLVVVAI